MGTLIDGRSETTAAKDLASRAGLTQCFLSHDGGFNDVKGCCDGE
jgi:hypothetical protein